jgi:hypothetical protein
MINVPQIWMSKVCRGVVDDVLALYMPNAVLVPTFDKSDLPGAGRGVLVGRRQLANYFHRFMSKPGLCGRIDSCVPQRLGVVDVASGLYTFKWQGGRACARYTFVSIGGVITTQHSSEMP